MRKLVLVAVAVLTSFTISSCGKSEEVKNVEEAITKIEEVKLTSNEAIAEVEGLYEALTEEDKSKVENYEEFESKRSEYDEMLKDFSDETKFCARSVISVYNTAEVEGFDVEEVGFVTVNDIKYSIVILSDPTNKESSLYIVTDDGRLVMGKTLGKLDDETEFTSFENPDDLDDDFIDNYDKDNNIDPNEALAIVFRYMDTKDAELIDISGFDKLNALENFTKNSKEDEYLRARLELVNVDFNIESVYEDLMEYMSAEMYYEYDKSDRLYDNIMFTLDVTRRRDVSGVSEELEAAKQEVVKNLTYFTYEIMMVKEYDKVSDTENRDLHLENAQKHYEEFEGINTKYFEIEQEVMKQSN